MTPSPGWRKMVPMTPTPAGLQASRLVPALLLGLGLAACSGAETAINIRLAPNPELNSERQILALIHSIKLTLDAPGGFKGALTEGQQLGPFIATDVDSDKMLELQLTYPLGVETALPLFRLFPGQNGDRVFQLAARGVTPAVPRDEVVATGVVESVRFYAGETIDLMVPFDLRAAYRPPRVVATTPRSSEIGVPSALARLELEFSKPIDRSSLQYLTITYDSSAGPRPLAAGKWELRELQVRELGLETKRSVAGFTVDVTCPLSPGTYHLHADALVRDLSGSGLDQDATRDGPDPFDGTFVVGSTGEPARSEPCLGQGGCEGNPDCNPAGGSDYVCLEHKCIPVKPTCGTLKCDPGYVCDEATGMASCVEDCRKTGFCGGFTYCEEKDGRCWPCDPKAINPQCGNGVTEVVTCNFKGSGTTHSCQSALGTCKGELACKVTVTGLQGDKVEWSSDCGSVAYTVLDGVDEEASFACGGAVYEQVTCLFNGSSASQQCDSPQGSCSGVGKCVVDVKGTQGDKIEWKSTCGGAATSSLDGVSETVTFQCGTQLKERVTCTFVNAKLEQSCKSVKGTCKGIGSCGVDLVGSPGEKVEWTGSCPGSITTIVDGTDEPAKFYCP